LIQAYKKEFTFALRLVIGVVVCFLLFIVLALIGLPEMAAKIVCMASLFIYAVVLCYRAISENTEK